MSDKTTKDKEKETKKEEVPPSETPTKPDEKKEEPKPTPTPEAKPAKDEPTKKKTKSKFPPKKEDPIPKIVLPLRKTKGLEKMKQRTKATTKATSKPVDVKTTTYFDKMQISRFVETDAGSIFTIDVQSDFRFIWNYLVATTVLENPILDTKGYPQLSPFTLIAYKQILIASTFLLNDLEVRPSSSYYASKWKTFEDKRSYLRAIQNLRVPDDTARLIKQLPNFYDPTRSNELFIPNLGSVSIDHDFGRLIPPSVMLLAHNILSEARHSDTPETLLRKLHSTVILTYDATQYTVGQLFGAYFQTEDQINLHHNWLQDRLNNLFLPQCGTRTKDRPSYCFIEYESPVFNDGHFDPYIYMLMFDDDHTDEILHMASEISKYIATKQPKSQSIAYYMNQASGITTLTHSIEPATLPTWHELATPTTNTATVVLSTTNYSSHINFLARPRVFKEAQHTVPNDANAAACLVTNVAHAPKLRPFKFKLFDQETDVLPDVLWFQPYKKETSIIAYSIALGLKIEQENIDGVSMPLPNIAESLIENNSHYLQGSIPIDYIRGVYPSNVLDNAIRIDGRPKRTKIAQPMGIALRDMSRNIIPRFARTHVRTPLASFIGLETVDNFCDDKAAFTYTAWSHSDPLQLPEDYTYLWSSYRNAGRPRSRQPTISFYATLRGHFGTSTILSKSENPVLLFPC